jgi:hypothetical protein
LDAAELIESFADDGDDLADAYVTMCVHAGIAAADTICCRRPGVHSDGANHVAAVQLLQQVDTKLASDLSSLLGFKTKSGYSALPSSGDDQKRAGRCAKRLVAAADLTRS